MAIDELAPPVDRTDTISVSLLTWLRVAIRWKRLVLLVALAVIILPCAVTFLLPSRYTAMVVILPPQQNSSPGAAMMAQLNSIGAVASAAGALGMKNPNDEQIALLKSRIVEDALIERFHLQELYHCKYLSKAREHWEKETKTDDGLKDGLIRLRVTDRDPHRAAEMANAWVEEYRKFAATLAITEASQRRLFYQQQLAAAHEDLARAEDAMKQTEQRTGVIDIADQGRGMIESAAMLRGQLAAKQIEIRGMREFAAEGNPDLQRAQQEAEGLEAQLAAMDAGNNRKTGDLIAPKGLVTQAALDYERALREVKYRETIQDLLMRQYEGARVDEARQGSLIQVVEPAVDPDRRDSSYRLWILLAGLVLSLPLALLTALAAEVVAILRRSRRRAGTWPDALEQTITGIWQ